MKQYFRAFVISLVTSALLFSRQIASFSPEFNRYFWLWDRVDASVMVGMVLAIALVGFGLYTAVKQTKSEWVERVAGHAFVALVMLGVLSNISGMRDWSPMALPAIWVTLVVALAVSLSVKRSPLVKWVGWVCVFFGMLPLILLAQVISWRDWGTIVPSRLPVPASREGDNPVFVFSFDAWSWGLTTENGEFREEFPNLRKLASQSWLFRNGISPDRTTTYSLPKMIFQTDAPYWSPNLDEPAEKQLEDTYFAIDGRLTHTYEIPSIFETARAAGYQTGLVTFYLPWSQILRGQADYVHVYQSEPAGRGAVQRCYSTLLRNLQYFPYPGSESIAMAIYRQEFSENWVQINREMQEEVLERIGCCADNTFLFCHFPLPHAPFVFRADGSYKGPFKGDRMVGTLEEYHEHLKYVDVVIGRLMDRLKASGKFDRAMIVLTSDHGWALAPEAALLMHPSYIRRVPILIKAPGQTEPQRVEERVKNNNLSPIFQLAMRGEWSDGRMREKIEDIAEIEKPKEARKSGPREEITRAQN